MTPDERLVDAAANYPDLTELKCVGADVQGTNARKQTVIIPGALPEVKPVKGRRVRTEPDAAE